jgi:hypothetical protein
MLSTGPNGEPAKGGRIEMPFSGRGRKMKAATVRQPYAWLIVAGFKPNENRRAATKHRGPLLIHAGRKWHANPLDEIERSFDVRIERDALRFGGVIGRVDLVDVVRDPGNQLYPFKWVLENPRPLPFVPFRGQEWLFDVPDELVSNRS